jgi:hypothetical protein
MLHDHAFANRPSDSAGTVPPAARDRGTRSGLGSAVVEPLELGNLPFRKRLVLACRERLHVRPVDVDCPRRPRCDRATAARLASREALRGQEPAFAAADRHQRFGRERERVSEQPVLAGELDGAVDCEDRPLPVRERQEVDAAQGEADCAGGPSSAKTWRNGDALSAHDVPHHRPREEPRVLRGARA